MATSEVLFSIAFATLFIVQMEGFGSALERLVSRLMGNQAPGSGLPANFARRTLLGVLPFSLLMLLLGSLHLLYPGVVLVVTTLPALAVFAWGRRWRLVRADRLRQIYSSHRHLLWGTVVFFIVAFCFFYRPITEFDSLWYHLSVPKVFLQAHSTDYAGPLVWYSLQPNLDFFINLWPMSLSQTTASAGIVINVIQLFLVTLGIYLAVRVLAEALQWGAFAQWVSPLLIGLNLGALSLYGSGYTDILGMAYGLAAAALAYFVVSRREISWTAYILCVLMAAALALFKIFFVVFAFVIVIYLTANGWAKLPGTKAPKVRKFIIIALAVALIVGLPWVVRSYLQTGRAFDPIGSPGTTLLAYMDEGSPNAHTHWTVHIFERFNEHILELVTFSFSPLVLIGLLAIAHRKIREQLGDLWLVGLTGFLGIFFFSIIYVPRYMLPPAAILMLVGVALIVEISRQSSPFTRIIIWSIPLLFIPFTVGRVLYFHKAISQLYLFRYETKDEFLESRLVGNNLTYYPSERSPRPADLEPKAPIYVSGIHSIAYIDNKIIDPRVQPQLFKDKTTTVEELIKTLKNHSVEYILLRGPASEICRQAYVVDTSRCELVSPFWHEEMVDAEQGVIWLKLNE